jgi:hypothetical protein
MPTISELVVKITGDASGLNKSVGDAETQMKKLGGSASDLTSIIGPAALGAAFVATAAAVASYISEVADAADVIDKTSLRTGFATDELQAYKYAAEQSGVSFGSLTSTISIMTRGLETNADTFKALGVETKNADGSLRSTQDIFNDSIAVLSEMTNETERNAAALKIFGRGAAELTPLLAQGSAGIRELKDRSKELGLIMSKDLIEAGVKFGDITKDLGSATKALGYDMAATLLPAVNGIVTGLTNMMIQFISGKAGMKEFQKILTDGVKDNQDYESALKGANEQLRILAIRRQQAERNPEAAEKTVEDIDLEVEKIKDLKRELVDLVKGRKANGDYATAAAKAAAEAAAKELQALTDKDKALDRQAKIIVDQIEIENKAREESLRGIRKRTEEENKEADKRENTWQKFNDELKKLAQEQYNFELEWSKKAEKDKYALLQKEYNDAIAQANKLGADTTAIEAWYLEEKKKLDLTYAYSWEAILEGMKSKFKEWGDFAQSNGAALVTAFGDTLAALGTAIVNQKDAWGSMAKIALKALSQILQALGYQLAALAVTTFPNVVAMAAAAAGSAAAFIASGIVSGYADQFAMGTDFAPGGRALVGENGPEVVNIPRGSSVIPAHRTTSEGSGGIVVNINSPMALNPSEAASIFKQTARELAFVGAM